MLDISHERHLFAQQGSLSTTDPGGLDVVDSANAVSTAPKLLEAGLLMVLLRCG